MCQLGRYQKKNRRRLPCLTKGPHGIRPRLSKCHHSFFTSAGVHGLVAQACFLVAGTAGRILQLQSASVLEVSTFASSKATSVLVGSLLRRTYVLTQLLKVRRV